MLPSYISGIVTQKPCESAQKECCEEEHPTVNKIKTGIETIDTNVFSWDDQYISLEGRLLQNKGSSQRQFQPRRVG